MIYGGFIMVKKTSFGKYEIYTLSGEELSVSVLNLGATITDISYKGRNMVLSYPTPEEYSKGRYSLNQTIGRYANRIGNASFSLDGETFCLTPNEGKNQLHSGVNAPNMRFWDAEIIGDSVRFTICSPDGDNGFPGNITMSATFSIVEGSALKIDFSGETDRTTVYAPTVHPYFNLDGSESVLDAEMQINSEAHLEVDGGLIPTGNLLKCAGSEFDFSTMKKIGVDFDDCFVLAGNQAMTLKMGNISMDMETDFPALQVYTGKGLREPFGKNKGIALEPEFYPDSPNHPQFPSTVLRPGDRFAKYVKYKFYV